MMFDVFLERPHDGSPEGRERLARALAERYRLDADVFRKPIAAGRRLRVKANVDEKTARTLARELEQYGALVSVSTHAETRPSRPVESVPVPVPSGTFTVVTVDGADPDSIGGPSPAPTFAPPPPSAPAAPSAIKVVATGPAPRPSHNVFAPPPDSEQPLELQLVPPRSGTVARVSQPVEPPRLSASASTPPAPAPAAEPEPDAAPPSRLDVSSWSELALHDRRGRLVAGLVLGLAFGFLPAHGYASFAEDKLDEIGAELARQPPPQTEPEYQLMLQQFDLAERRAGRVKTRIAVVTGAVWLLAGAGLAFGYYRLTSGRKIDRS
jgi:hypothetical protein